MVSLKEKMMHCLMPMQCSSCGSLFDLSYDIEDDECEFCGNKKNEHLCWRCRDK